MQGIAGLTWWSWLFLVPTSRQLFARPEDALLRLAAPDLLLFTVGSLAVAWSSGRGSRYTRVLLGWVTVWIALTLTWSVAVALDGGPRLSAICMGLSLLGTLVAGRALRRHARGERAAASPFVELHDASAARALWLTLGQVLIVWPLFLLLGPFVLLEFERILGLEAFGFGAQRALGLTLFALASAANLASAYSMASRGRGTPLPLACAPRLVVAGPYRWIRNPMALFGLGQGAAVGLWLGSRTTLLYVLIGALIWDLIVRPVEEADLLRRFGSAYERYRDAVRCWWPRLRPYREPSESFGATPAPARRRH